MNKAVFLEKDLLPLAAEAIKTLNDLNYKVFIVTKPTADMIIELAEKHTIDLRSSFTIGEWGTDIAAGRLAGTRTVLMIDKDEIIPCVDVDNVVYFLMEAVTWIMTTTR
jgi:hypothetical protein